VRPYVPGAAVAVVQVLVMMQERHAVNGHAGVYFYFLYTVFKSGVQARKGILCRQAAGTAVADDLQRVGAGTTCRVILFHTSPHSVQYVPS
jgi:hypothetical protein